MDVHRLGVKFFAADLRVVRLEAVIPVFHGWIQKQNIARHLLIDVHDYSHLHDGPGILLVALEGNFSLDIGDGRPGLVYYRKNPTALAPVEHLSTIIRAALQACRLLRQDGNLQFNLDELLFFANDRLNAPNDDRTFKQLQPLLAEALKQVFEGAEFDLRRRIDDPRERLMITCKKNM
jgi:hypothetical protein